MVEPSRRPLSRILVVEDETDISTSLSYSLKAIGYEVQVAERGEAALEAVASFRPDLVGRIVAICDVFDALTVRRPYKPVFPLDKAYSILRQGSGSHFDPAVVQAFFAAEAEILRTHHLYGDDSPDRPLTPAIIAANIAHPSSPHLLAVHAPLADETSSS